MAREELSALEAVPITELRREELDSAGDIRVDLSKPVEQRVESFLGQTKNPFAMNVDGYILQIGYMEGTEETFDDRMVLFVKKQAQMVSWDL